MHDSRELPASAGKEKPKEKTEAKPGETKPAECKEERKDDKAT